MNLFKNLLVATVDNKDKRLDTFGLQTSITIVEAVFSSFPKHLRTFFLFLFAFLWIILTTKCKHTSQRSGSRNYCQPSSFFNQSKCIIQKYGILSKTYTIDKHIKILAVYVHREWHVWKRTMTYELLFHLFHRIVNVLAATWKKTGKFSFKYLNWCLSRENLSKLRKCKHTTYTAYSECWRIRNEYLIK